MARKKGDGPIAISDKLAALATEALETAKKAKKHKKSLGGDNHYGNKMATLRAEATNTYKRISLSDAADSTELAKLIEGSFGADTEPKARTQAAQKLRFNLNTKWKSEVAPNIESGVFPLSILEKANRSYLLSIGRQMNGNYTSGWYDGAVVMMRRLVEISIIEAFEGKGIAATIKDGNGDYFQLSELVKKTLAEPAFKLSRNVKTALPQLRDIGHRSAHGRYFTAQKADLDALKSDCRVVVEEMLHHAGLL